MRSWYQKHAIWNHTSIKCEPYKFPWPSENVDAVYNLSPLYLGEDNFEVKFCVFPRNKQHRWSDFFCFCLYLLIIADLPSCTIDLIINCLDSPDVSYLSGYPWYKYITNWCNSSRAHVLAVGKLKNPIFVFIKWRCAPKQRFRV